MATKTAGRDETAAAAKTPLLRADDLVIGTGDRGNLTVLVSGVGLEIGAGETVGIVGESGSGKSLTARSLIGLLPDGVTVTGSRSYRGTDLGPLTERGWRGLRGSEIGLVMQDPFTSLNPLRTCGRIIGELLRDQGGGKLSRQQRRAEVERRLAEVGITEPTVADRYPFELSGGMRQRVAIAAALAGNPRLLIADEPTTALDTVVQDEILQLLSGIQRSRGMSLLLITHDLRIAFSACSRVYVMYAGQILETGPSQELSESPRHPYTSGLLQADPPLEYVVDQLVGIPGTVPAAAQVAAQCAFADRCEWAADECRAARPALRAEPGAIRATACVRIPQIRSELAARPPRAQAFALSPRTATEQPILDIRALRKDFTRGSSTTQALRGVDLQVEPGESVGLVGASGSGKTTLARCVVGLETATSGSLRIAGIDASDYDHVGGADRSRLRSTVQYVFQDPYSSLNPALTIGSTLREALEVAARTGNRAERPEDLLERVGLPAAYARYKPAILSGGERQRVAIARAIAVRPALIVCDEPVSALDVSVQAHVLSLLRELREETGVAYLFITHDLAVVRQMVDRAYVLYRGEVVEHGPTDQVLDDPQHPYTRRLRQAVPGNAEREPDDEPRA